MSPVEAISAIFAIIKLNKLKHDLEISKSSVVGVISAILQLSKWEYQKIALHVANLRNFETF